jgi:hypothetical protein
MRTGAGGGGDAGGSPGRSSFDEADEVIRAVHTTDDPLRGQSQHSNLEKYHWTEGYGSCVNSNDPAYRRSHDQAGNWQLMRESRSFAAHPPGPTLPSAAVDFCAAKM